MRVVLVAGARPNFVKIAPLREALSGKRNIETVVVHTGQHYDDPMSDAFFRDLEIPEPDRRLGIGSGTHAVQTARIMEAFDDFLEGENVDLVVVVGDVNSTVACSLTAVKRGILVAHVEAGLRSFDWTMPEEINRMVTDAISSLLFTHSSEANDNLRREGRSPDDICFVGNVMVDTLLKFRQKARTRSIVISEYGLEREGYAVLTLHRPSNVDDPETFAGVLDSLSNICERIPVVYPMHPRSARMLESSGLAARAHSIEGLLALEPLGYLDFLELEANARFVMTDSGGVQEETTVLGVPCLTLRENTERPVTVREGTNEIVGTDPAAIEEAALRVLNVPNVGKHSIPELWDGHAAERIADTIERLNERRV